MCPFRDIQCNIKRYKSNWGKTFLVYLVMMGCDGISNCPKTFGVKVQEKVGTLYHVLVWVVFYMSSSFALKLENPIILLFKRNANYWRIPNYVNSDRWSLFCGGEFRRTNFLDQLSHFVCKQAYVENKITIVS